MMATNLLNKEEITITLSNLKSGEPSISISTKSKKSNESPMLAQQQQEPVISNSRKRSAEQIDNGIIDIPDITVKQEEVRSLKRPRGRPRKDGLPPGSVVDLSEVIVKQEVKSIKKPRGRPRKDGLPPGSVVDLTN